MGVEGHFVLCPVGWRKRRAEIGVLKDLVEQGTGTKGELNVSDEERERVCPRTVPSPLGLPSSRVGGPSVSGPLPCGLGPATHDTGAFLLSPGGPVRPTDTAPYLPGHPLSSSPTIIVTIIPVSGEGHWKVRGIRIPGTIKRLEERMGWGE